MKNILLLAFAILPFGLMAQKGSTPVHTTKASPEIESLRKDLTLLNSQKKKSVVEYNVIRSQLNSSYELLQKTRDEALVLNNKLDSLNRVKSSKQKIASTERKFDEALSRLDSLTGQSNTLVINYEKKSAELKELNDRILKTKQQIVAVEEKNKKPKKSTP